MVCGSHDAVLAGLQLHFHRFGMACVPSPQTDVEEWSLVVEPGRRDLISSQRLPTIFSKEGFRKVLTAGKGQLNSISRRLCWATAEEACIMPLVSNQAPGSTNLTGTHIEKDGGRSPDP